MVHTAKKAIWSRVRRGFTLAEVLVATMIVGMCIAGAMVAIGTTTSLTSDSLQYTKATLLAQEVREWSMNTEYDDITDLRLTSVVPRDSLGAELPGYNNWSETIGVVYLNPNNITSTSASVTDVARISVVISFAETQVLQTSWLVVKDQP